MQSPNEPPEGQPEKAKRPLPPELGFLNDLFNLPELEPAEKIAWARAFLRKLAENGELMRKHGLDADRMIQSLEPLLEELERTQKEFEEGQEQLLHATADVGDGMRELVDALEAAVQCASEERPFDAEVQEWKEQVEELRKAYPKIE